MMPMHQSLRGRRWLVAAVTAVLAGTCGAAVAAGETIFFSLERDTPKLSPACQARLKGSEAQYKYWEKQVGGHDIFIHYHHYCFGVFEMQKAMTSIGLDRASQMALYRDAVTQFDYVLHRWPKNHPLYQESAGYKQILLMRLGRKQ
jgi:hypothetical protein